MNNAYNQMPLGEKSGSLTQFNIGNHKNELNSLFYVISIGPATFFLNLSVKFSDHLFRVKNVITYKNNVFIQSQTKQELFNVLDTYHYNLLRENMKAAHDESHFLPPVSISSNTSCTFIRSTYIFVHFLTHWVNKTNSMNPGTSETFS